MIQDFVIRNEYIIHILQERWKRILKIKYSSEASDFISFNKTCERSLIQNGLSFS